jgi:ribosomal protein S18 acetylase RimI-like enzyme
LSAHSQSRVPLPRFVLRQYHPSDLPMLYRICLETGADGADATGTIDPELLGHLFAAPYALFEPELCRVLTADGTPCGYLLGTADSTQFARHCERDWFPLLRERYRLPDPIDRSRGAHMVRAIHAGYRAPECAGTFPAHLHIDLLPIGQGLGHGPRMIIDFIDRLRERHVAGLHLGVSRGNARALAFYPKLGFEPIEETRAAVTYGLSLR